MKILLSLILLFAVVCGHAQNILVLFYTDNQPLTGLTNWPLRTKDVSFSTNAPGWSTNMTKVDYEAYRAARLPLYNAAESNMLYQQKVALDANIARLLVLHAQIPAGRTITSNDVATLATVEASLAAGTNTTAQTVIRIRQLNGVVEDLRQIQAGILEYLQRLGPVLKDLYKPDIDTAQ